MNVPIGIDPLVDYVSKRVLGSPEHKRITLHFLNAVLRFRQTIVKIEIQNPINLKKFDVDKLSILDIKATDGLGRRYNIEIQTTRPLGLPKRLTFYAAKQLIEQLAEGDQYADLNASISICLLDAIMFRDEPMLQHAFELRTATGLSLTDCLQVHILELPKYVIPSDNQPITDSVEQWLFFFREAANCTAEELTRLLPDQVFDEATGVLRMIAQNPEERQRYENRLKAERDELARTAQARLEGIEVGIEKGIEKGIREERLRTVSMLQSIVGDCNPSESKLSGLSLEDLAMIESDLQRRLRERG